MIQHQFSGFETQEVKLHVEWSRTGYFAEEKYYVVYDFENVPTIELNVIEEEKIKDSYVTKVVDCDLTVQGIYKAGIAVYDGNSSEPVETFKTIIVVDYIDDPEFYEYETEMFNYFLEGDQITVNIFMEDYEQFGIEHSDPIWYSYEPYSDEDYESDCIEVKRLRDEFNSYSDNKLSYKQITENADVETLFANDVSGNFTISTDTRTIKKGEVYLAIKGENFDGNKYIEEAINKGAVGYITSDKNNVFKSAQFGLYAKNTETAYLEIANFARRTINPKVVAVTGSSGKTTTKEMLYSVISQKYNTHKSYLNYNNQFGLCKTLLEMPDDTQVLISQLDKLKCKECEKEYVTEESLKKVQDMD